MENLRESIGKTFSVSANAPARQPVNIPPQKRKKRYPGIPAGIDIWNKYIKLPVVTPKIIKFSIILPYWKALYFSVNLSKTPSNVMKATYPADMAPPATIQNREYKISLRDIYSFVIPFTINYYALIDILFI